MQFRSLQRSLEEIKKKKGGNGRSDKPREIESKGMASGEKPRNKWNRRALRSSEAINKSLSRLHKLKARDKEAKETTSFPAGSHGRRPEIRSAGRDAIRSCKKMIQLPLGDKKRCSPSFFRRLL